MFTPRLFALVLAALVAFAGTSDAKPESVEDIVKRLNADLHKAVDKLAMNDPGKETVQTQDDIKKGLEELLKQQSPGSGAEQNSNSKRTGSTSNDPTRGSSDSSNKETRNDGATSRVDLKQSSNRSAEQYKDAWSPSLPQHKRQELESRTKGEFMHRYADMLDQYYRTIAEQSKKD